MIISPEIKKLVYKIENEKEIKPYLKSLIKELNLTCGVRNVNDWKSPENITDINLNYPIDGDFARSFDCLTEETDLICHWHEFGIVAGKQVATAEQCSKIINRMLEIMSILGMEINEEDSWAKDSEGTSILSRGFFELYHDNSLAQIRQNIRLYLHHVILWGSPFLWTSFDRLGLKTPRGLEAKGLPLHVDQNPRVHPDFTTIQGVVALEDCPVERGSFLAIPRSHNYFEAYTEFIAPDYKGEYIRLPETSELYSRLECKKQIIPLKKGDIISWDSRVTHANSDNISSLNRYVMYVSAGIAKEDNESLINSRINSFKKGIGINDRNAYLHASKKPRFTNPELLNDLRSAEQLSELGLLLYGLEKYENNLL